MHSSSKSAMQAAMLSVFVQLHALATILSLGKWSGGGFPPPHHFTQAHAGVCKVGE